MRSLRRGTGLGSRRSTNSTKETRFRHLLPLFWILHLKHKAHPALKSPLGSKRDREAIPKGLSLAPRNGDPVNKRVSDGKQE
ncbi:hypothetical protein OUZ56_009518 [Daphnia magna]|uniref:Uncharacterized protein n=1 Tax=Daphnia magna TaxID=35525 RepID=A0ABR0AGG8_9CRUS|nr:hypothetical protein OUZ56_009518 [Daphnia magna]